MLARNPLAPGRPFMAALLMLLAASALRAAPIVGSADDIGVTVRKDGDGVLVSVDCPVRAPRAIVWAVLTDYDHMARFVTDLKASEVRAREGDTLQVYQSGRAQRGLISVSFENLREIRLVPQQEIRSRMISGTLKSSEFTTRIIDDGNELHILNSGRFVPNMWVPPLIGPAVIEAETRKRFEEIRAEIMRRSAFAARAR
jgi:polyketide cyclase/dehydrase/lipid transport protein